MTKKDGMTFAEALKRDTLAGGRELNPGDRARWEAEAAEQKAQQQAEIERMVDAAIAKARAESEKGL